MNFLDQVFGGASNQYNPTGAYAVGTQAQVNPNLQSYIGTAQNNYNQSFANQMQLAQILQRQAQGQGPNPAQAMLNQSTGQNVANQAALAAGQRGASSNVGLIARQAGQAGAQAQQQAAGQAATMGAQQQLGAMGQLAGVNQGLASLANQNLGINQSAFGQQNSTIAQSLGQQQGQQGQIAQNNANFNQGILGGIGGGAASLIGLAEGGMPDDKLQDKNANSPSRVAYRKLMNGKSDEDRIKEYYQTSAQIQQPTLLLPHFAQGGQMGQSSVAIDPALASNSNFMLNFSQAKPPGTMDQMNAGIPQAASAATQGAQLFEPMAGEALPLAAVAANGGQGDELPFAPMMLKMGGPIDGDMYAAQGMPVPGQAEVKGNSYKNDKIPALLSPKEIILPRSITLSSDAPEKARDFVANIQKKHDFKGALERAKKERRSS